MKKVKGFTLIELIVVIAIIGILAALLVPSMMGYVKIARARELNSNARSVNSGAQLAIVDINNAGGKIPPNTIFTGGDDGIATASDNSCQFTLVDYLGEHYEGYFAFMTDSQGYGCEFSMWSEAAISASDVVQMTEAEVKATVNSAKPIGCHPLKINDGSANNNAGG